MTVQLQITGYDLSDEGPGRTVNEDATLIRMDLGLFAVADGAGGRGKGNVAASLALRSIENFVGATVRRTHERDHLAREVGTVVSLLRLCPAAAGITTG